MRTQNLWGSVQVSMAGEGLRAPRQKPSHRGFRMLAESFVAPLPEDREQAGWARSRGLRAGVGHGHFALQKILLGLCGE